MGISTPDYHEKAKGVVEELKERYRNSGRPKGTSISHCYQHVPVHHTGSQEGEKLHLRPKQQVAFTAPQNARGWELPGVPGELPQAPTIFCIPAHRAVAFPSSQTHRVLLKFSKYKQNSKFLFCTWRSDFKIW